MPAAKNPLPEDPELYRLVEAAALEGRRLALAAKHRGDYISRYWEWPRLSWLESGFPSIHVSGVEGPTDYSRAFSSKPGKFAGPIIYGEIESFTALLEYARGNKRIRSHFLPPRVPPGKEERFEELLEFGVVGIVTALVDRAIHLFGDADATPAQIRAIYIELEAPIFRDRLPVEILVPVALTKFDTSGRWDLDESTFLEEIDEATHLARYPRQSFWLPAHGLVVSAATHALVLTGYEIPSENIWERHRSELSFYPVEVVDRFFAAMRVVTGLDTGYAQIVLRPVGWAEDYLSTLPPLISGPVVRRYPAAFDDYGWLVKDRRPITEGDLNEVKTVWAALADAPAQLSLATRRLNSAMLRSDEADSMLDLCIGLESLLTGDETTELTHKLALRVAAVHALSGGAGRAPAEVFTSVKRIYKYRSKLVHGRSDAEALASSVDRGQQIRTVVLARDYLGMVIRTLLMHPRYLDPQAIDQELIAASLAKPDSG